jgi:hypothetical protein
VKKAISAAKAAKGKAAAKKAEPKADEAAPEDETETGTVATAFTGADEEEVIDKVFGNYAKESFNAAGAPSGEKVLFKEDAMTGGREII